MNNKSRFNIFAVLAVVIALADIYWAYLDWKYSITIGVALGILIFIANIAWLYFEM